MEPISVSAAIVGLLSAGASVTTMLRSLKHSPKFAKSVLLEVNTITTCLGALRRFVDGSVIPTRSRASLIMIDEVRVVLAECVMTLSELKETIVKLRTTGQIGAISRLKWTFKEQTISSLLLRLQGSRISLTLMLTTLNCVSLEQAEASSKDLRALVLKSLANDEKLARRLDAMQRQESAPWLSRSKAGASIYSGKSQGCMSRTCLTTDKCERTLSENPTFGFAFDDDLKATRVYQQSALLNPRFSLPSSKGWSCSWSILSDLSLSQVSNISVLSLPVYAAELYDAGHYIVDTTAARDDDGDAEQHQHPWLSIFRNVGCHEAHVLWPSGRIAEWMKGASSNQSLIRNFITDEQSGYGILYLNRGDMASYVEGSAKQKALWRIIQRLQCAILDEMLYHRREGDQTNFFSSLLTKSTLPLSIGLSKTLVASETSSVRVEAKSTPPLSIGPSRTLVASETSSVRVEKSISVATLWDDEDGQSVLSSSSDKTLPDLPCEAQSPPSSPSSDSRYESMLASPDDKRRNGSLDDLKDIIKEVIWRASREVRHQGLGSIASRSCNQDQAALLSTPKTPETHDI